VAEVVGIAAGAVVAWDAALAPVLEPPVDDVDCAGISKDAANPQLANSKHKAVQRRRNVRRRIVQTTFLTGGIGIIA
jgi:hypothetical protein